MIDISILSLNVRGLRDKAKRMPIFNLLKEFHDGAKSVVLLQETHSTANDEHVWESEWGGKVLFDHGTSSRGGVATLLPVGYNGQVDILTGSNNGRKLGIKLSHDDDSCIILNLYAPTQDKIKEQVGFFENLSHDIDDFGAKLIIGGDLNIYLTSLDKDNQPTKISPVATMLQSVMEESGFIDIWRILNPKTKRYTWGRQRPLTQSRLDYCK